jgi:hypothetical protein
MGDLDFPERGRARVLRLYWNVPPQGALRLMGLLTGELNAAGLPFQLKVFKDESRYERRDAAVLYADAARYGEVRRHAEEVYRGLDGLLDDGVPAFTKPLAGGLGLAEDPGAGESFGQNRCRLLAEALLRAHESGLKTLDARLDCVASRFREEGLNLDQPYLNAGSSDRYDFSP